MSHKRQRVHENGDEHMSSYAENEFHVTLGSYGTIKLAKESLQLFPSSLLTMTLLGDGIDQHSLYVPIGRGLDSFPRLIKDIYDGGVAADLPPQGMHFDLFVKWLKYLGLATPGRGLSTESEAHKRVSFFVETMTSSVKKDISRNSAPLPPRITKRCSSHDYIHMPADVERYISDLVPFEFARRGIHVTVKELSERQVKKDDVNLSIICPVGNGSEVLFQSSLMTGGHKPGRVTGVYMLGADTKSPSRFQHDGHPYQLLFETGKDGDLQVTLIQLDAGCSYDGRENIEHFLAIRRGVTDLVAEFESGDLVYSEEKHGKSLMAAADGAPIHPDLLLHGWSFSVTDLTDEDLGGAYLLVIETESLPFCDFIKEEVDRDDRKSVVWRFELEESPEWALENDGEPPLL